MNKNKVELIKCPICNHTLDIDKVDYSSGMDGRYHNWRIRCNNCNLIDVEYPADCFYGRDYYHTKDEVIEHFNKQVEEALNAAD